MSEENTDDLSNPSFLTLRKLVVDIRRTTAKEIKQELERRYEGMKSLDDGTFVINDMFEWLDKTYNTEA